MTGPLRYGTAPTFLGEIVVAATAKGVRLVEFLDGGIAAETVLAERFPGVPLEPADTQCAGWIAAIAARVDTPREPAAPVTLDMRGTPFQQKVWRALMEIPVGETRTYAELAARLGRPKSAARAVGAACAVNRLGVVVPCHRMVRGSGDLAGFLWGLWRKRALQERERGG